MGCKLCEEGFDLKSGCRAWMASVQSLFVLHPEIAKTKESGGENIGTARASGSINNSNQDLHEVKTREGFAGTVVDSYSGRTCSGKMTYQWSSCC